MADALVITGPTASGKTALSIDVARRLAGEIISMDSRQVYRGMDIGTAKPTAHERALVPHHGIDLLLPTERYSAGRFARDARAFVQEIEARAHVPILVGGTGFFLRALTHPMFHEPALDPVRREALKKYLATFSREELLRWLRALDETSARRLHSAGGRQRLARAVEVALLSGRTLTAWYEHQQPDPALDLLIVTLEVPREVLYQRINARVEQMLAAGLVQEVEALVNAGYDERAPGMNATGYIELLPYLRGETTLQAAADTIRANTRGYARRQQTWFRHQLPPQAIRLDATRPREELVDEIAGEWTKMQSVSSE
jgi:tRNA dimethylallyltransferase